MVTFSFNGRFTLREINEKQYLLKYKSEQNDKGVHQNG